MSPTYFRKKMLSSNLIFLFLFGTHCIRDKIHFIMHLILRHEVRCLFKDSYILFLIRLHTNTNSLVIPLQNDFSPIHNDAVILIKKRI